MLARTPWIPVVAWSQLPSRGGLHQVGTGELDWDVRTHGATASSLAAIILDGVN